MNFTEYTNSPSLKQLQGIDVMKYIMSYSVIAIHSQSACDTFFPTFIVWFINLAVPFFFITSGYLVARKIYALKSYPERHMMLKARALEIFRLFVLWIIIYLPLSFIYNWISGNTNYLKIIFSFIVSIITHGEITCAWPLWFLYSLGIYTLCITWCIKKTHRMIILSIIAFICLLADFYQQKIIIDNSNGLINLIYTLFPFRVLGGGAYIISGMFLYKYFKFAKNWSVILSIMIFSILLFYYHLPLNPLFGGMALFMIACVLPLKNLSNICLKLRFQSMWIYYLHMYFIVTAIIIATNLGFILKLWPTFLIVSVITTIFAVILTYLQNIKTFKFLDKLVK